MTIYNHRSDSAKGVNGVLVGMSSNSLVPLGATSLQVWGLSH